MDGGYKENSDKIIENPLKQNEVFLKYHKEIKLTGDIYCEETIERIERYCGCNVICNPHFDGISFYVKNEHFRDAQTILNKIYEEDSGEREKQERLAKKKVEASEKARQKFEERMAKCEQPDIDERQFAEKCLKTLKIEDYVQKPEAERYRQLYAKYSDYFDLLRWPNDVEGSAAKRYLNSSLIKNI